MPPTLIPAPSFSLSRIPNDDPDFEDDFDLPEGDTVIVPAPTAAAMPIHSSGGDDGEDWDEEFAPGPITLLPPGAQAASAIPRGSITHLASSKASLPGAPPSTDDNWDDDEDFDLPPLSSKPLKLSLSPRTKIRIENATFGASDNPSQELNAADPDDEDDSGNASTIKVSRLAFNAALAMTAAKAVPQTPPKMVPLPPSPIPPGGDGDDDFEDDLLIPNNLSHLALKPLPMLAHRASKASLDGWGDSTSSTLFSDASSGTLSQPSPSHSSASASASQVSTEDESDDLVDEDNDFEGLVLPDTLSSRDMQRRLEDQKKGVLFETKDAIRVARPSDGEDDFEMGLVIGTDEDLSPSRLKGQQIASGRRAVGKGAVRTMSEPQRPSTTTTFPPANAGVVRPPSRLREEILSSGRTSRESAHSPTLVIPAAPVLRTRPSTESFPSLRRAPSNIGSMSRQQPMRWQTLSSAVRPLPSSLNLPPQRRPSSPTKVPLPTSKSPSPYPRSPSPVSAASSTTRFHMPTSSSNATAGPSSYASKAPKHQKSFSKLPSISTVNVGAKRMTRKASLSSLVDSQASSTSPSVSPEIPFPSGDASRPTLRRVQGGGLSHAQSYRDLGGASATVGPSSSVGVPLERKRYAYEAPTVASRVRRSASTKSGTTSDGGAMSGSDRERERPPMPLSAASSRSIARSRGAISNIFPGAILQTALPTAPATQMRSPSPRSAPPSKKPLIQRSATLPPPPTVRILRRPKKSQMFGDGSELDGIEDLAVEREKESKFRVVPTGRGNVGQKGKTATMTTTGPTGTIGRRKGVVETSAAPGIRPVSSASSQGSIDPPKQVPSLRRQQRIEFPRTNLSLLPPIAPATRKKDVGPKTPLSMAGKRKPTLIKHLGGASSPKVVGDMKWNPKTLKWEGNDSVLREFEVTSSARPALITHLTGSSVGGLASPPGSFTSALASGARVVGEMMFDPVKMCWLSASGEDEEDPFAGIDEGDEDDWDADGKGGTIRAVLTTTSGGLVAGSTLRRENSGLSSEESSPARSLRGSGSHARSTSGSDTESVTGSFAGGTTGRESSLGAMLTIDENDDGTMPLPRDLVLACAAAEERHLSEMRGWSVVGASPPASATRKRTSGKSAPAHLSQESSEEPDRSYLWDIRALATRSF